MRAVPCTPDAYRLMHHGSLALSEVEANGMRVDVDYLRQAQEDIKKQIKEETNELKKDPIYKSWRRTFGLETNLQSGAQLARVLFEIEGYEPPEKTPSGKYKTDEATLEKVGSPFVAKYLRIGKLNKLASTYLAGVLKQCVGEFVHPVFNLHIARTYRSSSDSPNFQNLPIRNPETAAVIRRAFISRDDHQIVEIDYSGAEVRVAACYHKDPVMLDYICDPASDMHRDAASDIYMVPKGKIDKGVRHAAKNLFVFPQFYGSWFMPCARDLWEAIDRHGLTYDGKSLHEHLANKGITGLGTGDSKHVEAGTFEAHLKRMEDRFWNHRFSVYNQWRKDWWQAYQDTLRFDTLTGFSIGGILARNDVINYPVQGSAFHCLLWALIKLNNQLKKRKMRTRIVGQIHDSIVADVHKNELDDYLVMAKKVMTVGVAHKYPWLIVPMDIEAEVVPLGGSWYDKKEVEI